MSYPVHPPLETESGERFESLQELEERFPDKPWREPVKMTSGAVGTRYACRICIAMYGIKAPLIAELPETPEVVLEHIQEEHLTNVKVMPPTVRVAGSPKQATWTLIGGAPPGVCSECWKDHEPEQPHNQQSLQYQYRFYAEHDRWPSWADAMAHCSPKIQQYWREALERRGVDVDGPGG